MTRVCKKDCKNKKDNGNCSYIGEDTLPVQCIGSWGEDKYYFLERYLNATCEARRKFADNDNAVFIDLFCGPGKCIIRYDKKEIDSGGLRAVKLEKVPFNEYIFSDIDTENIYSLKNRIKDRKGYIFKQGDSNETVKKIVLYLKEKDYRYHFAYIDPFAPSHLKFETLKELAQLKRMDMFIHFPIGAIKRNIDNWQDKSDTILDTFLGTSIWRNKVADAIKRGKQNIYHPVIDVFKEQLKSIGYPEKGLIFKESNNALPSVPVKNTRDVNLYVLILAAKNPLAQKIWDSVIKVDSKGQKEFNF
ncbi:MAG: three-Cys-motif partner protein TcmP [Elusimicrobia bacterium]|nr:three-Cys-motif partner protein TcmP [Candidatus Liberimonas magnetica]